MMESLALHEPAQLTGLNIKFDISMSMLIRIGMTGIVSESFGPCAQIYTGSGCNNRNIQYPIKHLETVTYGMRCAPRS